MKKYELLALVGKTMERLDMNPELVKGLGIEYKATMKDTMAVDIVRDEKETMDLIEGLMSSEPRHAFYWLGIAIKTLAMSSK